MTVDARQTSPWLVFESVGLWAQYQVWWDNQVLQIIFCDRRLTTASQR